MKIKLAAVYFARTQDTVGNSIRLNILRFLSEQFLLVLFTNQRRLSYQKLSDIEIKDIPGRSRPRIPVFSDIVWWSGIAAQIRAEKVDLVFLFHDTAPIALWLTQPCFQYVHQVHEMIGLNPESSYLQRFVQKIDELFILSGLRKSTTNFVVSQPIIDYLSKKGVMNLELTPHGVDLSLYQTPYITHFHDDIIRMKVNGKFIVTYTGWVSEIRGLWLLLHSLREAVKADPKVVFVIAGSEDKYLDIINRFAEENELVNNLLNYGRVDHSLVPGILVNSDVCLSFLDVIPAYEMSPPQKVVEYFAAGKPVIANKIATHDLLIKDGFNGFIVSQNATDVSRTIQKLIKDRPLLETLSSNALKTGEKYQLLEIYGKVVTKMKGCLNAG